MVNVTVSENAEKVEGEKPKPKAYARLDLPKGSGIRVTGISGVEAGAEVEVVLKGKLEEKTEIERSTVDEDDMYPRSGYECRVEVSSISVTGPQEEVSLDEAVKASTEVL